ncbi:CCC motif membrane protein [Flavobacterium ardleyense]|uniref:CCC motif membrane protein n=1 Tax=Flavobacterium ardleyense TaxID=2038737 RepID=A0ABW5ZAS2_9FLAO
MENQKLPNATAVLILGILSILTCCCYGIISIVLGVIGIVLANKDVKLYTANPKLYVNYNNLKIGKVLNIIGIVLGAIYLIFVAWAVYTFGWDAMQDQAILTERLNEYFGIK